MGSLRTIWDGFSGINKLMSSLVLALSFFLLYSPLSYRGWQRQYWAGVLIGEPNDAAHLIAGYLNTSNGATLSVESSTQEYGDEGEGKRYDRDWYYDNYSLTGSFQLPPRQLELIWASIPERRFYRGTFELPAARVDSMFEQTKLRPNEAGQFSKITDRWLNRPAHYLSTPVTGLTVVVRPGPGGRVRVWLAGADTLHIIRLGDFQAQAFQPRWGQEPPYTDDPTPAAYWRRLVKREENIERTVYSMP